ncbi:hypothetical protein [Nocardioides daeguensis]|uniref:Monooxygenase n=1 Tax=Nocardioides daeguensis TaxID=908359 RepID=A0ABP6WG18_9ACTN|nr:hypothetical protein [Nocardioides daeguensis]MBV6728019.1 hypothetical protein [Nocardioides daeguensis]MCR1774093.1 hypothetical protein [Nocardioides daeguensis]
MRRVHQPLPSAGAAYLDARGDGRAMRVSWHAEAEVVVLSLWRDNVCTGTFQLALEDVPGLVDLLAARYADAPDERAVYPPDTEPIRQVRGSA